jgi:hypothetical protein
MDYCIDAGDRWQIMKLTYRVVEGWLLTDQPSDPREERTPWVLEPDGGLMLGAAGARSWFRRGERQAPAA